jgi:hypothetical protein
MTGCRHRFQPYATRAGIGHRCLYCGDDSGVVITYEDQRNQTMAYIFRDARQEEQIAGAVSRMRAWAAEHPEADTQGLMDDEWEALARAALDGDSA